MSNQHNDSNFVQHVPCDNCGSSDANSLYDDGHQYCFACETFVPGDGEAQDETKAKPSTDKELIQGKPQELGKRGLDIATARKWNYTVGKDKAGRTVQIANYYDKDRKVVAQKL